MATILAIETSCDETAVALSVDGKDRDNIVYSQEIHRQYGGVVPELASRAHEQQLTRLVDQLLRRTKTCPSDLDAVAFTQGPGLLGALIVGCAWAKAFAWASNLPLIAVDHLHAHIMSQFIEEPYPNYPFLALLASGGHTQLLKVTAPLQMEHLGTTQDDAVGEAFDKIAHLLGLTYPGGPALDKNARRGDPDRFTFPLPKMSNLDYSFSGIKTSCKYFLDEEQEKDPNFISNNLPDLCASIERALIDALLDPLLRAQEETKLQSICIAGGTAANTSLRHRLNQIATKQGWKLFVPALRYCTDNAAMVACAAYYLYKEDRFASLNCTPYTRSKDLIPKNHGHREQKS